MSSESVRIVHITTVHCHDDVRIYRKEAVALSQAGYDVVLIAPEKTKRQLSVKLVSFPIYTSRIRRILFGSIRACITASGQSGDIYHIHDPELLLAAILLKILRRAKIVYDVHENYTATLLARHWLPTAMSKSVARCFGWFEKTAARWFDLVVAATEHIAGRFHDCNVVVVRNFPICCSLGNILVEKAPARQKIVIYVGGLTRSDGIEQLLRAVRLLEKRHSIQLVLAGEFSEPTLKLELEQKLLLRENEFLGWLGAEEVRKKLLSADIGIVCPLPDPNNFNALPNKLFEYMCNGLPVVASNFGSIATIVKACGCGVLVDPLQPEQIAKGICHLLEYPQEAWEMGQGGREAVLRYYNWEAEKGKLLNAYRQILG